MLRDHRIISIAIWFRNGMHAHFLKSYLFVWYSGGRSNEISSWQLKLVTNCGQILRQSQYNFTYIALFFIKGSRFSRLNYFDRGWSKTGHSVCVQIWNLFKYAFKWSAGWSAPLLFAYSIRHVFWWPASYKSRLNTDKNQKWGVYDKTNTERTKQ